LETREVRPAGEGHTAIQGFHDQLAGLAAHRDGPADDVEVQPPGHTGRIDLRTPRLDPYARPTRYAQLEQVAPARAIVRRVHIEFDSLRRAAAATGHRPAVDAAARSERTGDGHRVAVPPEDAHL